MKKVLATVVIMLGLGFSVSAQSDGFFNQSFTTYRNANAEGGELPRLPGHNLTTNQDAPVGTGLLLLTGLGLGYAALKKRD